MQTATTSPVAAHDARIAASGDRDSGAPSRALCRIGAFAALGTVVVAVIQAPLFILASAPTTILGYDEYAAATTEAQRAAFLAAGEALWATYNGTAFGLFFILSGIADIIVALVMLRGGQSGRLTAWVGIVIGVLLLVPPLPPFGAIPLASSYLVIIPSLLWSLLVARGLLRSAAGKEGA